MFRCFDLNKTADRKWLGKSCVGFLWNTQTSQALVNFTHQTRNKEMQE